MIEEVPREERKEGGREEGKEDEREKKNGKDTPINRKTDR